jgi:putative endonuclease
MSHRSLYNAYVYMLSNKNRTVLYTGVTNNLERRMAEHRSGLCTFTKRYNVHDLVYYEVHKDIGQAIAREKNIKNWKREWKEELIKEKYRPCKRLGIRKGNLCPGRDRFRVGPGMTLKK